MIFRQGIARGRLRSTLALHVHLAKQDPRFVRCPFKATISTVVDESKYHELPMTAWRLAQLPVDKVPEGAWETFEAQSLKVCGVLRGEEIALVLHACTVARRRPKRLLARLAEEIPDKLPQFDISAICICLHAYAQMRERDRRLFAAATRRLLAKDNDRHLSAPHLASLLYSHARAVLSDQVLSKTAQTRLIDDANTMAADDLATTLQAFLTFRLQDRPALIASSRAAVNQARDGASLQALCTSLYALARMNIPCEDLGHVLAKRCQAQERDPFENLPVLSVVQFLYGIGDASWGHGVCNMAATSLGNRLSELDGPKILVQTLEAFVRSMFLDPPFQQLNSCIAQQIVNFSVKDVIATASACKRLGPACDEAVLEALARQALRKGWRFKSQHVQNILEACETAGFHHPAIDDLRTSLDERESAKQERLHCVGGKGAMSEDFDGREHDGSGGSKQESLEDQPFFQERRLGTQDIAAVASAAQSWGRGQHRSRRSAGITINEESQSPSNFAPSSSQNRSSLHHRAGTGVHRGGDAEEMSPLAKPLRKTVDDPSLRQMLKDYEKDVLRPAGLQSEALRQTRRSRRNSRVTSS